MYSMLASILRLSVRNFLRSPVYSFVVVSGLVVGIATAILILLWVRFETSYDTQDPDADRVFAVVSNELVDGEIETQDETYVPLADFLAKDVAEVEAVTRVDNTMELLKYGDKSVNKVGIYADSGYFSVFPAELIDGVESSSLVDKKSIAISEEIARLLFDRTDGVGKFVTVGQKGEFQVTAVFKSYPDNNSLNYVNYIIAFDAIPREQDEWQNYNVKLYSAEAKEQVEKRIDARFAEFFGNKNSTTLLVSLKDWRLRWSFVNGKMSGGRIVYVVIFSIIGVFILLMACINYVNIATARATRRAREIGVRKVTGATRLVLIRQFLFESLLLSTIATAISVGVVYLLLPMFKAFTNLRIDLDFSDPVLIAALLSVAVFSGLVAGIYPAFALSAYKPAAILRGIASLSPRGVNIRKSLMVFQFVLSTVMIFGALIMWQQTDFLLKKDLGYDRANVINVWLPSDPGLPLESIKEEIANRSSVEVAALGGASPMEVNGYSEVKWAGMPDKPVLFYGASAGADMVPALGLRIIDGRNFSKDRVADSSNFIITKRAASILGFENPVGQRITYTMFGEREGEIIGVIDDFNNDDIHLPIAPVVFFLGKPDQLYNMFVRYRPGQMEDALSDIREVFKKYRPDGGLNYSFLDSDYSNQLYRERFFGKLSITFTIVAIVIAALGLFGLTLFNTERRTKEIGIRKVLGASTAQVLVLLFKEFFKPVVISLMIAFPVAQYLMSSYLEGFAYRISLSAVYFLNVAIIMILMIILVVSYQSYRAAIRNPVESLKTE